MSSSQTQPESPTTSQPSPVTSPEPKRRRFHLLSKKTVVGVLVVLLAVVCVAAAFYFTGNKVVFTVGGENYRVYSVERLTDYPVNRIRMSKNDAAKAAFNAYKQIKTAEELGYTPSQADINTQKQVIYKNLHLTKEWQAKYDKWFTLMATQNIISAHVGSTTTAGYKGYSFVFFYGQHLQSAPDYTPPGLNDSAKVAADKAFAKSRAQYYHDQLQNHKMSAAEVFTRATKDMRSRNYGTGVDNPNFSTDFSNATGSTWSSGIYLPDIVKYISSLQESGLSGIQVGKATTAPVLQHGQSVDMYYYFVDLTAVPASKSISSQEFNQSLAALPASFKGY